MIDAVLAVGALLLAGVVAGASVWCVIAQRRDFAAQLEVEHARIERLLDRLQSRSLEHFRAFDQLVEEPFTPDPGRWVHDETGLVGAYVPVNED